MFKAIVGIVLGIVLAGCLVALNEAVVHRMIGGAPLNPKASIDAVAAMLAAIPLWAKIAITAGWAVAAFAASGFAGWFAEQGSWPSFVAGSGFFVLVSFNLASLPHPTWMVIAATVGCFFATYLGSRLLARWPKRSA
jgi:hypothetical protein